MRVNGPPTQKIMKMTEELRGHDLAAPMAIRINAKLDAEPTKVAERHR